MPCFMGHAIIMGKRKNANREGLLAAGDENWRLSETHTVFIMIASVETWRNGRRVPEAVQ